MMTRKVAILLTAVSILLATPSVRAQSNQMGNDEPTAFTAVPVPEEPESGPAMQVLEAICWYIPNRIVDITDIPRIHLAAGDGMGASLRMTKWLMWASWFHDDTWCLGWTKRTPPLFGESIDERYFSFLAAHKGELDRDKTEIGLSLHFAVVGANLAVSVGEAVDCLLGFVGVDLMADDHGPVFYDATEPEAPAEVAPAAAPAEAAPAEGVCTQ
jgi:hypothetical protein